LIVEREVVTARWLRDDDRSTRIWIVRAITIRIETSSFDDNACIAGVARVTRLFAIRCVDPVPSQTTPTSPALKAIKGPAAMNAGVAGSDRPLRPGSLVVVGA
jgi:hypothetical protein